MPVISLRIPLLLLVAWSLLACSNLPVEPARSVSATPHTGGQVVAFSPDGEWLVSGGWEGGVQVWRTQDARPLRRWQAHRGTVNGIVFAADGASLVTAGYDGRLVRWTLEGEQLAEANAAAPFTHMVAADAAGLLVAGHADGSVSLWRTPGFEPLARHALHGAAVRAVAVSGDARMFASSSADGSVLLWDRAGTPRSLPTPVTDIHALAFAPAGDALLGGTWFKLYRWSLPDGAVEALSTDHTGIIRSIEFLPDAPLLATISRQTDSSIYFLDPVTGATVRRLGRHDLCGTDITVSNDGRYIATTSDDATIRVWDLLQ